MFVAKKYLGRPIQFRNGINIFWIGIEVSYKKFNPQINLEYLLLRVGIPSRYLDYLLLV